MLAVLRVDDAGRVVGTNDAARALLGPVLGQRCCDAVLAREGRAVRCEPACALGLARGEVADRTFTARVRDRLCGVCCSRVGDEVVVVLRVGAVLAAGAETLTAREREVLTRVAVGEPSAKIARRLGLHPSTVRTHVERARQKLGARSRAEAVARAIERGEIPLPLP